MAITDLEEIVNYYANLLIIQYNGKQKAKETIELNVNTLLSDNIVCEVQDAFNLETAVGAQLDILGKYIGVDRFFASSAALIGEFFSLTSYPTLGTDSEIGMTDFANYDTDIGGFASYEDLLATQTLNDDDYRTILKLRIVQNNSDHSHKSIDDGLFIFFANSLIMSANENMTMVYFVNNSVFRLSLIAFSKGVLPRPMGVKLNGLVEQDRKMFGFTNYNRTLISNKVTGFTNYVDGFTKEGEILTYEKVINF
jgi:hypothetical protein